jgi:hypothetical protein
MACQSGIWNCADRAPVSCRTHFLKIDNQALKRGQAREKTSRHEHQELQRPGSMGRDVLRIAGHRGGTAPGQTLGRALRIRFPGAPQEHPNFPRPGEVHHLQDGTLLSLHHQNPTPRLQERLVRLRSRLRNSRRRLVHPPRKGSPRHVNRGLVSSHARREIRCVQGSLAPPSRRNARARCANRGLRRGRFSRGQSSTNAFSRPSA